MAGESGPGVGALGLGVAGEVGPGVSLSPPELVPRAGDGTAVGATGAGVALGEEEPDAGPPPDPSEMGRDTASA